MYRANVIVTCILLGLDFFGFVTNVNNITDIGMKLLIDCTAMSLIFGLLGSGNHKPLIRCFALLGILLCAESLFLSFQNIHESAGNGSRYPSSSVPFTTVCEDPRLHLAQWLLVQRS